MSRLRAWCAAFLLLAWPVAAQDKDALLAQARQHDSAAEGHARGGRLRAAQKEAAQALALYEKALGEEDLGVAAALDRLGGLEARLGEYRHATPHLERALRIRREALPAMHPDVANSRHALARVYVDANRYVEAADHLRAWIAQLELMLDEDDPRLGRALAETAAVLAKAGDDKGAETMYRRAIGLSPGPRGAQLALELGDALARRGEFARGLQVAGQAAAYMKKNLGGKSAGFAVALNAIGAMYDREERHEEAYRYLAKALEITLALEGKQEMLTASITNNMAGCLASLEKHEDAKKFYTMTYNLLDSVGQKEAAVAVARNLAGLHIRLGEYERAAELLSRIVDYMTAKYPQEHPEMRALYGQLAELYAGTGDLKNAVKFEQARFVFEERDLETTLMAGTERQRASNLARHRTTAYRAVSLHAVTAPDDPAALELAFAVVLRHKGRLLDAISRTFRAGHAAGDDGGAYARLQGVRSDLSALTLRRPDGMDDADYKAELARLRALAEKLEAEVARARGHTTTLADLAMRAQPITAESVRKALPEGAALADYFHLRPFHHRARTLKERWGAPRYVVYIVGRKGAPQWVDLGETAPIDELIGRFRRVLADPRGDVAALARQLDAAVFEPVRARIGGARTVFVSPDGALNVLPFAALVDAKGRFALETHRIHYLMSGRDLMHPGNIYLVKPGAPVVIADPAFGRPAKGDTAGLRFGPLAGTVGEAEALRKLFPKAQVLTKAAATEAALKAVKSPRILHVATHGFFLTDLPDDVEGVRAVGVTKSDADAAPAALSSAEAGNPLLRSGIALAGANRPAADGGEDGIVTALELASLDLSVTKLAVLSACETGVGEIRIGDGVHGLRRALAIAGAESQMISLWKVHDEATRDLMIAFYKRLLAGESRLDALRDAQLGMLRSAERKHPFFWAAFIVSGHWRPVR